MDSPRTLHLLMCSDICPIGICSTFRNKWLTLYTFARMVKAENYQDYWHLLLSGLVFVNEEVSLEHLLLLHAVAVYSEDFPEAPSYNSYSKPNDNAPNEAAIKTLCERYLESFETILRNLGRI